MENEIDLSKIFAKIEEGVKKAGLTILVFIAKLKSLPATQWKLFLSLLLIGALSGFYYSYYRQPYFESSMVLSSEYLNKRIMDDAIEKLNLLAAEKSPKALARTLNVNDTLADNILKFSVKPFVSESDLIEVEVLKEQLKSAQEGNKNAKVIEQVVKRIEIENRHAFEITIRMGKHETTKAIQEALVNYFRNNQYVSKRIESTKMTLKARREKLLHESQKLDSLKRVIYANYQTMAEQTRQGSNNVVLSDKAVTNPIEVYTQDLDINDQIQYIDKQLYLQPDFEVVVGLTEFNEPASASMPKVIVIAALIGFAMGYVIVALRNFNNYLSTFS